jgi:hypothetical protein
LALDAIRNAQSILAGADVADDDEILRMSRAAMAELERAELLAGRKQQQAPPGEGAKGRILAYFLARGVDVPVSRAELRRVSGIQEWARRVRELRVEGGWDIRHEANAYRLISDRPSRILAESWRLANSIRARAATPEDRALDLLKARVGVVVNSDLIAHVSGKSDARSMVARFRSDGYEISTCVDRPDLGSNDFVLERIEPSLDAAERRASETTRATVLERDGYACVVCGTRYGPGNLLAVHALSPPLEAGETDPEDFVTLCQTDREGMTAEQVDALLKGRRKRARSAPQQLGNAELSDTGNAAPHN